MANPAAYLVLKTHGSDFLRRWEAKRFGDIRMVVDDVLLDAKRAAAGVVGYLESQCMQGIVHYSIVGEAKLLMQRGEISVEEAAPPPVSIKSNCAPSCIL